MKKMSNKNKLVYFYNNCVYVCVFFYFFVISGNFYHFTKKNIRTTQDIKNTIPKITKKD